MGQGLWLFEGCEVAPFIQGTPVLDVKVFFCQGTWRDHHIFWECRHSRWDLNVSTGRMVRMSHLIVEPCGGVGYCILL